ncbi:hypothetical protein BJ741DRAFT_640633, partial [Chytriomyces cf. hyalinus JEL632]
ISPLPQQPQPEPSLAPIFEGQILSVKINQNKLISQYLSPIGSVSSLPDEMPEPPDLNALGHKLEQSVFIKNIQARPCVIVDIQKRHPNIAIGEEPPVTICLITGFDGKQLRNVLSPEEIKRAMPIYPTPVEDGTPPHIHTTPPWLETVPPGKLPSFILCLPIKVHPLHLRFLQSNVRLDASNFQQLKLHLLSLGKVSAIAHHYDSDGEDEEEDVLDLDWDAGQILTWNEVIV